MHLNNLSYHKILYTFPEKRVVVVRKREASNMLNNK